MRNAHVCPSRAALGTSAPGQLRLWNRVARRLLTTALLGLAWPWGDTQGAEPTGTTTPPLPAWPANVEPGPGAVDLRPLLEGWGIERRRQGARPTCSVFVVTTALEYAAARNQGSGPRLSVEFLNWAGNQVTGQAEDGGFFSDLWKGFAAHGLCAEQDMPYRGTFEPAAGPSDAARARARSLWSLGAQCHWIKEWNVNTGLTDEHLTVIKTTLRRGWPVCGGFRWPKQEKWENQVLQFCPPDAVRDGHSVLLVGCREEPAQLGGGLFILRNTSADGRDGFMPYGYAQAYMNDALWIDFDAAESRRPTGQNGP